MTNTKATIKLEAQLDLTNEIEWYIKAKLPEIINEFLFKNPNKLDNLIKQQITTIFKNEINAITQGTELRELLREKITKMIIKENKP